MTWSSFRHLKTQLCSSYHGAALELACRLARFFHVSTPGRSCQSRVQAVSSKLNRRFAGLLQSAVCWVVTVIAAGRSSLWKQISGPNHSLSHEGIWPADYSCHPIAVAMTSSVLFQDVLVLFLRAASQPSMNWIFVCQPQIFWHQIKNQSKI